MAELVASILLDSSSGSGFKSTAVDKELEVDVGNLLCVDNNPLHLPSFRKDKDGYLEETARDNIQVLINTIWELPVERLQEVIIAKLPPRVVITPREKPIPKPRAKTRWEEYASAKGIQKRIKSKLVWDDILKKWTPRWGYQHAKAEGDKDWLMEVPDHADPYEDQFAKRNEKKSERVAKNELHRLRNIARAKKIKVPGVGVTPTEQPSKEQVGIAAKLAKLATASVGKFTEALPLDKPLPKLGKKRKFEPMFGDMSKEKSKNLDILRKITSKVPKLNISKAMSQTPTPDGSKPPWQNKKKSKTQLKKIQGKQGRGKKWPNKGNKAKGFAPKKK